MLELDGLINKREKLEEDLRHIQREINNAVWPNINDAMDFQIRHELREQIAEVGKQIREAKVER